MTKLGVITGSSRPNRFNIQPAKWIYQIIKDNQSADVKLLDLAKIDLPIMDEPESPMKRNYQHQHTKAWSKQIQSLDGFVMVTPEYNHSVSPVLKNAIDYLYYEWNYKPVAFISYGSEAGGTRAVEHLRGIAAELRMYDLREQLMFPNYWDQLNDKGEYQFTDQQVSAAEELVESLTYWAEVMKPAREKLTSK